MHRNPKQTTNNPTTKQTRQLYNKRKPHKNNKRLRNTATNISSNCIYYAQFIHGSIIEE